MPRHGAWRKDGSMDSIVAVARRRSLRSLLAGSILGGALVVLFRRRRAPAAQDLSAFDGAPCFRAGPDGRLPGGDGRPVVAPRAEE